MVMRILITLITTTAIFLTLFGTQTARAFDLNFIFWPDCNSIANVVSTGTGGLKGTIDPAGTGTCPVGQQHLSCKQPQNNPMQWLRDRTGDQTIANILAILVTPVFAPLLIAINQYGVLPAYVCRGAPAAANLPSQVSTEIGVLNAVPDKLILSIVRIFSGLAGGISLLLMLSGAAKYLTSSGNPEALEEAKGIITSALGGFLLVFLSVFLLRFIGIDVLGIPGLSPQGGGFVTP